ncbi:MAG TPA: PspC domain-containing protein [Candidatus Limnocylindria bacterium]
MQKRLERSVANRVIAGVCGGLADYFLIDATLVRVFFVFATIITGGVFFLAYIAGILLMPLPDQPTPFVRSATPPAEGAVAGTTPPIAPPRDPEAEERRRNTIGYLLVALGGIFLLANLGAFRFVRGEIAWPLVLIAIGVLLLVQRARR